MNKRFLKIIAILTVSMIVIAIIGKKAGWFGKAILYKVSTEKPQKRTIIEVVTANGKIQPQIEVKLSPDVSGEIIELLVKEGELVKAGQLLLKIKPESYQAALERMEAALNTSKSNLATAKAQYSQSKAQFTQIEQSFNRNKKLFEQGAISQAEYESATSAYEVGKANIETAQENINAANFQIKSASAALNEAKENLSKTSVFAPMNGTISSLSVEKGERVVGTSQFSGTELLRVADLNLMEVKVQVNENDIVRVHNGDTADVEIDAYLNRKFKGIVTEIANSANSSTSALSDQVTNFDVKILLLKSSYSDLIPENQPFYCPFRPGMSATVDIRTETHQNVISVPIQAVTTRSDSLVQKENNLTEQTNELIVKKNTKEKTEKNTDKLVEIVFVYNNKDKKVYIKKVTTGIQDNMYIEIISGLTIEDEVISAPYSAISKNLKDKMEVQKTEKDKIYNEK